jgi:hypothetical protein
MKKTLLVIATMLALSHGAKADVSTTTVVFPPTASTSFLEGQIVAEIINHGTFSEEYRRGEKQIVLSDNIIEAGHLNSQYVAAIDASLYQNPLKTNLDAEVGLRLNLHALVNRFITFTPAWQTIVGNLEYYPRVGYDFGQDRDHVWFASFNLGLGFGPGAGISAP